MIYLMACFVLVSWLSCFLSRKFLAQISSCSVAIDKSINYQFNLILVSFLRPFLLLCLVNFDSSAMCILRQLSMAWQTDDYDKSKYLLRVALSRASFNLFLPLPLALLLSFSSSVAFATLKSLPNIPQVDA